MNVYHTRSLPGAARLAVVALMALLTLHSAPAAFDLVNLGSNSFSVDPGASTASYEQTAHSLVFSNTYGLGDTLGGTFAEQNWNSYGSFGLRMALVGTNNPGLPFTVQFFDADFGVINTYQASTADLGLTPGVVMLALSVTGTEDFSRVVGMQFTWDSPGSIGTSLTEIVGLAVPDAGFFAARAPGGVSFLTGLLPHVTGLAANATNWTPPSFAAALPPGAASWAMLSDSNAKTGVSALDHREILRKISSLPVASWQYKHDPRRRHMGPMAQDFHAAFSLGDDDRRIATIDTDGVALSALKGLIVELKKKNERSAAQAKRLAALEAALRALHEKIKELPSQLPPRP
jgi:hypothetical protein